jgi:hypothetical protein
MRVLMTRRADRTRSESGATAILVGFLFVALLAIAAFTTDFGMAYVSKRQLQTAADAAVLAAAAEYATYPGTCADLQGNAEARADADAAAAAVWAQNLMSRQQDATGEIVDNPECNDDGTELEITFENQAATEGFLSGGDITTSRLAAASVSAADNVHAGLRPYIVCSNMVPEPPYPQEGYVQVDFPDEEVKVGEGNCPHPAGNWFTLDCPHEGNGANGNPDLAHNTEFGCDEPVAIVENQDPSTPLTLSASLIAACVPMVDFDEDCLSANPGEINGAPIWDAWNSLLGKSILLPVFCGTPTPCDPVGIMGLPAPSEGKGKGKGGPGGGGPGGGDNALYPIYRFAGVKVCGWHWGSKNSGVYSSATGSDDPCYGADASAGDTNSSYLLLHFTNVATSGKAGKSTCVLGTSCDTGPRNVTLTR